MSEAVPFLSSLAGATLQMGESVSHVSVGALSAETLGAGVLQTRQRKGAERFVCLDPRSCGNNGVLMFRSRVFDSDSSCQGRTVIAILSRE